MRDKDLILLKVMLAPLQMMIGNLLSDGLLSRLLSRHYNHAVLSQEGNLVPFTRIEKHPEVLFR